MLNYKIIETALDDLFMNPDIMEEAGLETRGIQLSFNRDENCLIANKSLRFGFDEIEAVLTISILAYDDFASILFIIEPEDMLSLDYDILNEFNSNERGTTLSAFFNDDDNLTIQAKSYCPDNDSFIYFIKKSFLEFMDDNVQGEIVDLLNDLL